jgi:tRNA 2-thiouridine synthesizing protein A
MLTTMLKKASRRGSMAIEILDLRGKICPIPLLLTKRKLESMNEGEVLEVLSDFPQTTDNIQSLVERIGSKTLKVEEKRGSFRIVIRKGPSHTIDGTKQEDPSCPPTVEK